MTQAEKTVFISYRRKDISWAMNVYQYLTNQKYDAFFDFTHIPSGDFEQIIISNIKARAHFVLILTPTALDRCSNPGDWLRREIETAIDERRNIVPLFFDRFSFSSPSVAEKLTGKMANISRYNGLDVPLGYFPEAMERLKTRYLNTPLDAVLHPVSDEVKKVVRKEKRAANKAIRQSNGVSTTTKQVKQKETESGAKSKTRITRKKTKSVSKPLVSEPASKRAPARHAIYTFGNMEFVKVPAGKFLMGSNDKDKDVLSDERPQHTLDLPEYYMGRFPVTNVQYAAYIKAKRIKHPVSNWKNKREHPVTDVSWYHAMRYCVWLNNLLKDELPSGIVLRLPTEAEWEKAARGEKGFIYPWGDVFDSKMCNTGENEVDHTTQVGAYSPQGDSLHGCADMSGNVWEWTRSLWGGDYGTPKYKYPYRFDDGRENDKGSGRRVLRGGSFGNLGIEARCAYRGRGYPRSISMLSGFRVVASSR